MFLDDAPSTRDVTALYDAELADDGYVMNLVRAWAWRPDLYASFASLRTATIDGSALSDRDVAVLVAAAVSARGDSYCSLAWGAKLSRLSDAASAAGVLGGASPDGLTEREHALADWARHIVRDPATTTQEEVDRLRAVGLDDRDILSATALVAWRLAFSAVSNALGATPDAALLADAPREVADVVTYGRPADVG